MTHSYCARKRPGQWTWRARYLRTERIYRAWMARNTLISIRDNSAAPRGPRAPRPHPTTTEPRTP